MCHKNTEFLINQKTGYISIFLHNYTSSPLCIKVHSDEDDYSQQVNEINKHLKIYIYIYIYNQKSGKKSSSAIKCSIAELEL